MPDVVVAGSINMDVVASTARHPRPGETVTGRGLQRLPGGKGANQAVAAARTGATVRMIGAVGDDDIGTDAVRFLEEAGVNASAVSRVDGMATGMALVVVAEGGENTIVVVPGANDAVDDKAAPAAGMQRGDVLVTQYEIPRPSTVAFLRRGREAGATNILNPAPAAATPPQLMELVDVLVVNESELGILTGVDLAPNSSEDRIVGAIRELRATGLSGLAVATLGPRGALTLVDDRVVRVAGHEVDAVDTTGAGDCFVGALAAELARGTSIRLALEVANAAAAVCVTRAGAGPSMPTRAEATAFRSARRAAW